MGIRGEVFTTKVILENRTYFFNVKENRMGDLYLNIVESKNKDSGGFDRQSIVLFADDLQDFLKGFDESLRVMEKAFREQRATERAGRNSEQRQAPAGHGRDEGRPVDKKGDRKRRVVLSRPGESAGKKPRRPEDRNDRGPQRGDSRKQSPRKARSVKAVRPERKDDD